MARANEDACAPADPELQRLLDEGENAARAPYLLVQLCRAEQIGQTDAVNRLVSVACERAPSAPVVRLLSFRFGQATDLLPSVRDLLNNYEMPVLRYLFPTNSPLQGSRSIEALRQLTEDLLANQLAETTPMLLYNLLILNEIHHPSLTPALCQAMLDASPDVSAPVALTLNRMAKALVGSKRPARILTRERPLRTAICISGQLRGYKEAFESWRHFGLDPSHCRIFVHSWTEVGRKYPTPEHAGRCFGGHFLSVFQREVVKSGLPFLERRFPRLFEHLLKSAFVTEKDVQEFYGAQRVILEDHMRPPYANFTNSQKMHYKMHAAHQLAVTSREDFDLYIRIRPDKSVKSLGAVDWHAVYDRSLRDGTLTTNMRPSIFLAGGMGVADEFAVGAREPMSAFVGAWTSAPMEWEGSTYTGFAQSFHGHETLFWNGLLQGIRTVQIQASRTPEFPGIIFGGLLDQELLPSELLLSLIREDTDARIPDDTDRQFLDALMS